MISCANPPAFLAPAGQDDGPIAPGTPGFDETMVDRLVRGLTPKEQVRSWFGEPDVRSQHGDGTSEWIYNKARLRVEDPEREAMVRQARKRQRAAEAKQLEEETLALVEEGRRTMGRFGAWLDRKLFYPPSPERRRAAEVREREWAEVDDRKQREKPPAPVSAPEDAVLLADESSPVTRYDLAIGFTRDGVVDDFRYQRTAGRDYLP